MAQPGNFTPIMLYGSSTPGNVPLAANLTNSATGSEIAINVADKNLFFKDSTNTVNTVPIRQSSTSSNGWLSSTDWNTFNNKQPAGTYVTSVSGTAPVVSSGGTTPAISMAAATTSVNGYLTSTDWNTFNGKQASLVSGTNIKTVGGVSLLGSGDVGTIGVGYGGTGLTTLTAGYIPYGNGASAFSSTTNLKFDGVTLAVGGTQSAWSGVGYIVQTPGPSIWGSSGVAHYSRNTYFDGSNYKYIATDYVEDHYQLAGNFVWRNAASGSAGANVSFTTRMQIHASGGVSIGNTTDPGATNLSVTGNTVSAGGTKTASGTTNLPSGTATTIFSASSAGLYMVFCYIPGYDASTWAASAVVISTGGSAKITATNGTGPFTLTLSGTNVQATQGSGGAIDVSYVYERII